MGGFFISLCFLRIFKGCYKLLLIKTSGSIRTWAEDDRPREKLLQKGRLSLSNAELIAIILGSGNRTQTAVDLGKEILRSVDDDLRSFSKLTIHELKKFNGVGEAKAVSMVAAMELSRRIRHSTPQKHEIISSSRDAFSVLLPLMEQLPHEEFWVLYLSNANRVLEKRKISSGGITGTVADTRLIFRGALEVGATAVILSHNHPSGKKKPSQADVVLTKKVFEAGDVMEVKVLDHIIIADTDYFSFADEGMIG